MANQLGDIQVEWLGTTFLMPRQRHADAILYATIQQQLVPEHPDFGFAVHKAHYTNRATRHPVGGAEWVHSLMASNLSNARKALKPEYFTPVNEAIHNLLTRWHGPAALAEAWEASHHGVLMVLDADKRCP